MSILDRFIDYAPGLRCSRAETLGRITRKSFVKDSGFGDCPMKIEYDFIDASGQHVSGGHVGTESSFGSVEVGDQIRIRYLESDSTRNAPTDALGIITQTSDKG
jgi:hypothetical protein